MQKRPLPRLTCKRIESRYVLRDVSILLLPVSGGAQQKISRIQPHCECQRKAGSKKQSTESGWVSDQPSQSMSINAKFHRMQTLRVGAL